ncbi:hypothetical protein QE152_g27276 [Popillia japonica]|uniref:Uncharacterized protein n=1 Tax=Popillia japonica TaxID=7064 RepID=A0AAW1JVX8_POPJA
MKKEYRRKVHSGCQETYYGNQFISSDNKQKTIWKMANKELNKGLISSDNKQKTIWKMANKELNKGIQSTEIKLDGTGSNPKTIAHKFAEQFATSAKNKVSEKYGNSNDAERTSGQHVDN